MNVFFSEKLSLFTNVYTDLAVNSTTAGRSESNYARDVLLYCKVDISVRYFYPTTLQNEKMIYFPRGSSWFWSYGSWIYNYLCNQFLSPLKLWVWIQLRQGVVDTTLCDKVCQWLATGRWFSPSTLVSSTNKTDNISEILLKET